MEVVEADFLPFEGQLYLIVIDANMDMHVLQYDPERRSILQKLHSEEPLADRLHRSQVALRPALAPSIDFPYRPLADVHDLASIHSFAILRATRLERR